MLSTVIISILGISLAVAVQDPFFRRDYTYIHQFDAFYKLHSIPINVTVESTFFSCEDEESSVFYPNVENEWTIAKSLLLRKPRHNVSDILIGIRDEFGIGIFTTVNGGFPFSSQIENDLLGTDGPVCVTMNVESGTYKAVKCDAAESLPFVCKKQYKIEVCPTVDTGYTYIKETRKCYKFHERMKTWRNAMQTCFLEGGSLLLIRTAAEADIVRDRLSAVNKDYFVGFRKLPPSGELYTVNGQKFDDTYYKNWYSNDNDCGNIFQATNDNKVLHTQTISCLIPKAFVCEMVPKSYSCVNWATQVTELQPSPKLRGLSATEPELSVSVSVLPDTEQS